MRYLTHLVFIGLLLSVTSVAAQPEAKKFAEVGQIPCDDVLGYLDYFAGELRKDLNTKGYIVFYGGRSYRHYDWPKTQKRYRIRYLLPRRGEAEARVSFWKSYLIETRDIDGSRIEVIDGGYRERPVVDLWIVPAGAKTPLPTPTLTAKQIRFRRGTISRNEVVMGCY